MADNDNNQSSAPPVSVRVDLTSQDLRTGVIRLPLQLHDRFAAGEIQALAKDSDDAFLLSFSPPRELGGLQEFLSEHELRTNDAVVLHVDGQDVRLEPFYRRPREAPEQPATVTHAGLFGDVTLPAELPDQETPESDVETEAGDPRLQPGLFGQSAERGEPDGLAPEQEHFAEQATGADAEPAAPAPVEQIAEPTDFTSAWSDDHEDDFETDPGFAAFTQNTVPAYPPPAQSGDAGAPDPATADDDDLPPMPAWRPPAATGLQSDTANFRYDQQPAEQSVSAFHAVQRRPFTPRGRPQPRTVRPVVAARSAAARTSRPVREQPAHRKPAATGTAPESGPAETTENPAVNLTPRQQLLRYLDSPELPSILQAKQVAQALKMTEEEAASELAELSQLPDSRLSTVRPGFYLLKRENRD